MISDFSPHPRLDLTIVLLGLSSLNRLMQEQKLKVPGPDRWALIELRLAAGFLSALY
jgi:hypothetical protein